MRQRSPGVWSTVCNGGVIVSVGAGVGVGGWVPSYFLGGWQLARNLHGFL